MTKDKKCFALCMTQANMFLSMYLKKTLKSLIYLSIHTLHSVLCRIPLNNNYCFDSSISTNTYKFGHYVMKSPETLTQSF